MHLSLTSIPNLNPHRDYNPELVVAGLAFYSMGVPENHHQIKTTKASF